MKTIDIADNITNKFREQHTFSHYTGTLTLHGMARRAIIDPSQKKIDAIKKLLAPYIALKEIYGNFESYYCGGTATAWLLYKGLYPESEKSVYRCAEDLAQRHRRTPEGIFTFPRHENENIIWIDTAFAVTPFLVYAGLYFNKPAWVEEGFFQIKSMYDILLDPACSLLHQSKNILGTGIFSQDHWSRGNGWGMIALAEVVQALPVGSQMHKQSAQMFTDLLRAALHTQDADGMWHQEMTDHTSYVETSGTGLLLYGLGVALEEELAEDGWREAFLRGINGYRAYIALDGSVHNTCQGCLCPEDGSIDAYKRRGHLLNDCHAHGPAILALTQAHCIGIETIQTSSTGGKQDA